VESRAGWVCPAAPSSLTLIAEHDSVSLAGFAAEDSYYEVASHFRRADQATGGRGANTDDLRSSFRDELAGALMIATLNGKLKLRDPGRLIVETAGLGYEIFVPLNTYYRMPSVGAEVELEIRQIVREDAILLYGFATAPEKQAFDLLMSVQHVGAKLALAVLSVLSPKDLAAAITGDDVERLDAVPGVGAKVAERIVRELRDKTGRLTLTMSERMIAASADGHTDARSLLDDAVSALLNLGYKPAEAKRAVDSVEGFEDKDGLETLIRKSLAIILGEK
jgi:holliday junction DNA helicase RuvA